MPLAPRLTNPQEKFEGWPPRAVIAGGLGRLLGTRTRSWCELAAAPLAGRYPAVDEGMAVNGLITNTWVVSFAATLAALAVLRRAGEWVRSRRGVLTGTYIALIQTGDTPALLTGIVRCRHIGQRLTGNIAARAQLTLGANGNVERFVPVAATYRFAGRVRARQVLLSYWSAAKASHHGGAMTMVPGAGGVAFRGIWCGTAPDGQVISGPCLWIKASGDAITDLSTDQLAARVESALRLIANPWRKIDAPPIRLDKLLSYAAARDALQRVEPGG